MFPNIRGIVVACIAVLQISNVYSSEQSLVADVDAHVEYNDNIFLTSQPHDGVSGLVITPKLAAIIKEANWEASFDARIRSNNYSDDNLDSNDQYFNLTGRYLAERNIFSLNANYDLDSNLTSTSTDFGISGRVVNRKIQSVTPQYNRLLTERLVLSLSYTYSDVDYLEAEGTGYTPYVINVGSVSLNYDLSERDQLTFSLQGTDYASKNDLVTYQLFVPRLSLKHEFSEILSADFSVGVSRNNITNLSTQSFDFFGNVIVVTQEIDSQSRGLVMDAGLTQLLESGSISGRISRNNVTDSFGGLNQVDRYLFTYRHNITSLWRYTLNGRYEDITAISSGNNNDRDIFFFEARSHYSFSRNWDFNASYRYIIRKFKSDTSDDRAPHSNRIFFGLTYNFPSLSTF